MPYKDPIKAKQYAAVRTRLYKQRHKERLRPIRNARNNADNHRVKRIVFEAYGNICVCCGEDTFVFLTMDHVNNDGHNVSGTRLYRKVRQEGFPKDKYRLLCWNCNCGRAQIGDKQCPHKKNLALTMGITEGLIL